MTKTRRTQVITTKATQPPPAAAPIPNPLNGELVLGSGSGRLLVVGSEKPVKLGSEESAEATRINGLVGIGRTGAASKHLKPQLSLKLSLHGEESFNGVTTDNKVPARMSPVSFKGIKL